MFVRAEIIHWVSKSMHPFDIVKDCGFQSLMKTRCLEYPIPSPMTISHDVCLVFACTQEQIARMMSNYDGKLNFTTDARSLPNHHAFMAFCVHLEHAGQLLSLPLDIVEVVKVGRNDYMPVMNSTDLSLVSYRLDNGHSLCTDAEGFWNTK